MIKQTFDCVVIGGGPAGILAAGTAAGQGRRTILLERGDMLGRKLRLAGGGRCNVTNNLELTEFMKAFGRAGGFLRPALAAFGPEQLKSFLADVGISLYQEEENFFVAGGGPALVEALKQFLHRRQVKIIYGQRVTQIDRSGDRQFDIATANGHYLATQKIIITTGGKSYPSTGSTGDGFALAQSLGHEVTPLVPALGPLRLRETVLAGLAGLAVPAVQVEVLAGDKREGKFSGDLLITHHGLSGPAVLDAGLIVARALQKNKPVTLRIDLKRDLDALPHRLRETFLKQADVDTAQKTLQITRQQRQQLTEWLSGLKVTVAAPPTWEQAMVTVGGVALDEVEPRTMESRIVPGLHFAGEILDLAASCGGYNIQAAFATGHLAGTS